MFFDPMPTPAGRAGRFAALCGVIGWVAILAGTAFYYAGQGQEDEDVRIAGGLDRTGRVLIGIGVVSLLAGIGFVASGMVQKVPGIPDPGVKTLIVALIINAIPMVGIAGYVGLGIALAKIAAKTG